MKKVNVGIIGLGTVGGGVVRTLIDKQAIISDKAGIAVSVVKVFDSDTRKARDLHIPQGLIASDAREVIDDVNIDILVELIGGIQPANDIIIGALCNGKHIVTANKALIASYGKELFEIAEQLGCSIGFEASVCGAVPVIKILNESFSANSIQLLYGIVNGTSNFILSRMALHHCSMKDALKEAQARGLAEANPKLDIDGGDACHKLCILAMLAFGKFVKPGEVYVEGIRQLDLQDMIYAKDWGYDIKLLAVGKRISNSLELRVHPTLVPADHLITSVKGEDNAVFIKGDMIGESMLYGKGAGRTPAASSVISDIMDISRNIGLSGTSSPFRIRKTEGILKIADIGDLVSRYYLRFLTIDEPGVLAAVSSILARNKISIATVSQIARKQGQAVPIVMLTHEAKESAMNKALKVIDRLPMVKAKTVRIRIEK
ncbi:MAG: homoserine dehydrogenase [Candidatus Omnitrophica bacterium]|nr:homoserine dehydrogenase [Candidatus Omnitrophota bacterium]